MKDAMRVSSSATRMRGIADLLCRVDEGHRDRDAGSAPRRIACVRPTAVRTGDRRDDRQAEPRTLHAATDLHPGEAVEDPAQLLLGDAGAAIPHPQLERGRAFLVE